MFGGHSASRKLGGPEMYSVASSALTAGVLGKRMVKRRAVRDDGAEACRADFDALRSCTMEHVCGSSHRQRSLRRACVSVGRVSYLQLRIQLLQAEAIDQPGGGDILRGGDGAHRQQRQAGCQCFERYPGSHGVGGSGLQWLTL